MTQKNREPSTAEIGKQVPARPHDSGKPSVEDHNSQQKYQIVAS
jgi:hypothetical protein